MIALHNEAYSACSTAVPAKSCLFPLLAKSDVLHAEAGSLEAGHGGGPRSSIVEYAFVSCLRHERVCCAHTYKARISISIYHVPTLLFSQS